MILKFKKKKFYFIKSAKENLGEINLFRNRIVKI